MISPPVLQDIKCHLINIYEYPIFKFSLLVIKCKIHLHTLTSFIKKGKKKKKNKLPAKKEFLAQRK